MRIITTILFSVLFVTSCSAKTESNNNNSANSNKSDNKVKTIHLTKAEFLKKVTDYETNPSEWKYLGDKPALIDFYADWCRPCRIIAPTLEELASEYDGEIYVYKIDTENEQELARFFRIQSIPSLLFIPMNGEPQMKVGVIPKAKLKESIDGFLLKK